MARLSALFILLFVVITGCVQVQQEYPVRTSPLAISSARDLPISYPAGSKFFLAPKYLKKISITPEQQHETYRLYGNEIVSHFDSRGYELVHTIKEADFVVGYSIALTEDLSDHLIDESFGVMPGLAEDGKHKKGSLLIYVSDVLTSNRVWRGTAQGFAQEDMTSQERKERISHILSTLLLQFDE